jgi:hypothetical protein
MDMHDRNLLRPQHHPTNLGGHLIKLTLKRQQILTHTNKPTPVASQHPAIST